MEFQVILLAALLVAIATANYYRMGAELAKPTVVTTNYSDFGVVRKAHAPLLNPTRAEVAERLRSQETVRVLVSANGRSFDLLARLREDGDVLVKFVDHEDVPEILHSNLARWIRRITAGEARQLVAP